MNSTTKATDTVDNMITVNEPYQNYSASSAQVVTPQMKAIMVLVFVILVVSLALTLSLSLTLGKNKKKNYNSNLIKTNKTNQTTQNNNEVNYQYSIMTDLGSTSTRYYVYTFPKRTDKSLPQIEERADFKKNGGVGETTNLSEYFSGIFENETKTIMNISNSKANLSEVPIFLKATAGIRSLNQSSQDKIVSGIRKTVKEQTPYLFQDDWAGVINGIQESYFGWVTVNYVSGVLKTNDDARTQKESTLGSMDMGGSSIEISYVPNGTEIKENKVSLNLGYLNYDIYSNVIEGYGENEVLQKLNDFLVQNNSNLDVIQNPCYLVGYSQNYTKNTSKLLNGTGNYNVCLTYAEKYANDIKKNYSYFPDPKNLKFIALSGFAFTADCIGITDTGYISPKDFLKQGEIYCSETIQQAQDYRPKENVDYLKDYCFITLFDYFLFVNVFGLSPEGKNIMFTRKVNGYSPTWALGAMTYEAGRLPSR